MGRLFSQLATKFGRSPEDLATEGLRHVLSHRVATEAFVEYVDAQSGADLPADLLFRISGTINLGRVLPSPLSGLVGGGDSPQPGASARRTDPMQTFIRLMLEHQPGPLVLLPPGTVPKSK